MNIDLNNKLALVTGASGELGRVMARTLAACGADIAVHYGKSRGPALALVDELRALGRRAEAFQADITKPVDVERLKTEVAATLGMPVIVVANAVVQYQWKGILDQPLADFDSQFESCVRQSVLLAKAFIPSMKQRGVGRYIAISTECTVQAFVNQGAYVAGKRGLDGLLRVLAKEVGPSGVTVNQVAPGWTVSDRDRAEGTVVRPEYDAGVPLRRRGTDQEVANAVAFLASDLASFITGAWLPVTGGNVIAGL
jgi:3-oxoacyl-[acyl-carrier protein] reductase